MKKTIYMLILAAVFSACNEDISMTPALSLYDAKPEILDETAIFRLAAANLPDKGERIFPVTFGGTAERGVDYEASADAFVFGGESPVDSIVVTTLKFGTERTVSMSVELPEGMTGGHFLSSEYTLHDIPAFIGFDRSYKILADSTFIRFTLTDRNGKIKSLKKDIEVFINVDRENSTAEEGVDFVFADSSDFIFKAGESRGELKLKMLKPLAEAGKDRISLSISHEEKYGDGIVAMELEMLDSKWNRLEGKWKIDTLVTDTTYMETFWGERCTGYELFPKYNSSDAISFSLDNCLFEPSFRSDFDLFFIDDSNIAKGPSRTLELGADNTVELQTLLLDNTNRYFSKTIASDDKESYIGLRLIEGIGEAQEEVSDTLDFYLIDYVSKSFMPELESLGLYAAEKPVATAPGQFINIRFIK